MSAPVIRRVRHDLFFVEWGNVRFGGTFSELATFAAELQSGMTKALAGDPEDKRIGRLNRAADDAGFPIEYCQKCHLPLNCDHTHRTYEEHDACRNASRAAAPVALPNLECGDEEHLDPAIKLLADVMHLWVDGYISKNPKSMAPDSISSDVFEAVERLLSTHEIAVDYCGWHIKPVALPTHQIVESTTQAGGIACLQCSCGRYFIGLGGEAHARASFEAHLPEKEGK